MKLSDFGFAKEASKNQLKTACYTPYYAPPEVLSSGNYNYACDIWSVGCILVEFFTGDALFQTHDNLEHLAMMENVCGGKLDTKLARQVVQGARGHNGNQAAK